MPDRPTPRHTVLRHKHSLAGAMRLAQGLQQSANGIRCYELDCAALGPDS